MSRLLGHHRSRFHQATDAGNFTVGEAGVGNVWLANRGNFHAEFQRNLLKLHFRKNQNHKIQFLHRSYFVYVFSTGEAFSSSQEYSLPWLYSKIRQTHGIQQC